MKRADGLSRRKLDELIERGRTSSRSPTSCGPVPSRARARPS